MMKFNEVATATLDQLTDELAAAGIASNFTDVDYARDAVYELLAEMGDAQAIRLCNTPPVHEPEVIEVAGCPIQYDKSGVGHCWTYVTDSVDCPVSIQEEIAAEIIDGGNESCDGFRASNGFCYRW